MATTFRPNDTIVRGDLDIFLTDGSGNPTNAVEISYAIYFVDPGPPEVEVLVGPSARVPMNPVVGEYYASLIVPQGATAGTYRIRWRFRQSLTQPFTTVVYEFTVEIPSAIVIDPYSTNERSMVDKLRLMLRDQCVGGEEEVELDVAGERMIVRMDDLWDVLRPDPSTPGQ